MKREKGDARWRIHFPMSGSVLGLFDKESLMQSETQSYKYEFVTSQLGKQMILVGGYTFSKHRNSWVCSAKSHACRAKLKLDSHQNIVQIYNEHNHPSRYRVINGRTYHYFQTLDTYFFFSYGNKYYHRYIDFKYRVTSLLKYKYEFVKSQMGKQLILIGGYTFAKLRPGPVWVCSTRKNGCKAKLILGTDQKILHLFNKHAHYPRYRVINGKNYQYEMVTSQRGKSLILFQGYTFSRVTNLRWSCSTHYPACKAILRLTKDKTVRDFTSHNHPSRKYIITNTGKHSLEIYYEWVLSQKGKKMIMVDGYTYSKKSQNGWVCSTRNAFCRARLRLNAEGLIIYIDDKHSHAPKNQFRIRYKEIRIYEIPKGEGFDSSGWVYVWSAKRKLLGMLFRQESLQGEN
uniref:SFRICE_011210 n=1 Tax=Spodoptera frugiperda TaxID=7108 RepID=A0A2H1VQT2_SPOFR